MHGVVVQDLVVNLVREHHQIVLARQFQHAQQHFLGIHRTRRVVRVDDDHGFGVGSDFGFDISQVRPPVGLLITQVVHRMTAGQGHGRSPQRVVRCRHQNFVTVVEQCLQ